MMIYALHATLPMMVVMLGTILDIPAWKSCQEPRISGYAKTV